MKNVFNKDLFNQDLLNKSKATLAQGKQALSSATDKVIDTVTGKVVSEFKNGLSIVKEVVNGLPVFASLEQSATYQTEYDEKHYFVIPYRLSETGFSLHTIRCLPKNVHELNDLPKRRVFHFANEYAEGTLKLHMLETAQALAHDSEVTGISTLESLADNIDALDTKLTYGMLLVGGLAAIVNPLVGAGIAAKALLPGVGSLVSKYGLRPVGEKQTQAKMDQATELAQARVMQEFSEANTIKVINPILQELELALNTEASEHDPLLDPNLGDGSLPELDNERWRELTGTAMFNVYREVYEDPSQHQAADLGPEDIRWFKLLFEPLL